MKNGTNAKRLWAVCLAACLLVGLVAGCSPDQPTDAEPDYYYSSYYTRVSKTTASTAPSGEDDTLPSDGESESDATGTTSAQDDDWGDDWGDDDWSDDWDDTDEGNGDDKEEDSTTATTKTTTTTKKRQTAGQNQVGEDETVGKDTSYGRLYTVEEFGALGNGVADDSQAIADAITEAKIYADVNTGKKAVVQFGKNKSYKVEGIELSGAENVTLQGDNSTIIGVPTKSYLTVTYNKNVTVKGLNFTYDTPVAATAKVTAKAGNVVEFEVPEWYVDCIETNEQPNSWFAIPVNSHLRNHAWIKKITKVDETHCKVEFLNQGAYGQVLLDPVAGKPASGGNKTTNYCDLPTPGYSHNGTAFGIRGNDGSVYLEDINVWNISQFGFQVNGNSGKIYFTNVHIEPKDKKASQVTVSWRDLIHAKENRGGLIFDKCNFQCAHDDVFNISNTTLRVEEIAKDGTIRLYGEDYGGNYHSLIKGDTVVAINAKTDKYYGKAKIKKVVKQYGGDMRIQLDKDLKLEVGAILMIDEYAAPAIIKNSTFSGSFRIRACGSKITNSKFYMIAMWTAYEGINGSVEGPIPENITYTDCYFAPNNPEQTGTRMTFQCLTVDGPAATSYGVKNIRFKNCDFAYDSIIDRSNPNVIIE